MKVNRKSPKIWAYPDFKNEKLVLEVELPDVERRNIRFKIHRNRFYIYAKTGNTHYIGSYEENRAVDSNKAKAVFSEDTLKVTVPYWGLSEPPMDVKIE